MTLNDIPGVVADLRRRLRIPVDPTRRGPVPLDRYFAEVTNPRLRHHVLPDLTRGKVIEHLRGEGIPVSDAGNPDEALAGFLFKAGNVGWAYVSRDARNPIGRQRFTAAHEFAHAVLHRDTMPEQFVADTHEMLADPDTALDAKEREANRFAVEVLMPEEICRVRAEEVRKQHGCCPRAVMEYRLAAELLVSVEAARYRLKNLGVGDE
jgi:hypothetical protein